MGDEGWKSIRWEVYDKYSGSLGALEYSRPGDPESHWSDGAYPWLEGKLDKDEYGFVEIRGKCSNGRKYNKMLPVIEQGE